jgi:putative ABC transport system permease protein
MIDRPRPGSARRRWALDDLDRDIRDHIEREIQDNLDRGMPPEEARRQAMLAFGNVALVKEDTRRVWIWAWLDEARQDLRYAARTLRKSGAFATAAAVTLALVIGANTTMFSVLNAVLLRPLPYQSPEQLAMLWTEDPTQNLREARSALWNVEQWRSQSQSFADMAVFDAMSTTLTGSDGAEQISGASMSPNMLSLLGVKTVQGRSFSTEEIEQQQQRQVLISHRFWQTRFGGSGDAIGSTLVLNGVPSQIIGVLPADFRVGRLNADVWTPRTMSEGGRARPGVPGPETWSVIARLRPHVTIAQAQAELSAIAVRLNDQLPAIERNRGIAVVPLSLQLVGPESRQALWMLGGAVFFVFLIAAANVASLSLARSVARAREMAVRVALGASAGRIVRQLLTESGLLGVVSGLMGILLAVVGIRFVRAFGPGNLSRLNEVNLDVRVLVAALAISLLAGILVGLAPALTTLRRDPRPSAEEGGRSVTGGAASRRIRSALVVAEYALAIVVLVGAGLLVRSWWQVKSIDPGFKPERILMVELSAPATFNVMAQRIDLYQRVLEQIHPLPGVESAGIIGDLFIGNSREYILTVEGDNGTVPARLRLAHDEVSADFFKTLGTPLLRGRFFSAADGPDAAPVAIVNETMARRAWPARDPVGKRFKLGPRDSERPWYTVVGVVGDMRLQGLEREPVPQIFESLAQTSSRSVDLFIRSSSDDPAKVAASVRAAVHQVDKDVAIYGVGPLEEQFATYLAQRRFQTLLLIGFSVVALLIATVGIYGLIQYSIATRTPEIGLRIAIGAQAGDIFRMIISEGLRLTAIGLAIGLVGAWWLGRAGSSLLFGVTATDPLTFMTVSFVLTLVATTACFFPARRAMRVDPIVALRVR